MSNPGRIEFASMSEIAAMLRAGDISSTEITRLMLDRIESLDQKLNAFVTVTADLAMAQARTADSELADGLDRGPLHGIPIAVKDLFETKGVRTTAGSKYFESWIPGRNAAAVERLMQAGAVLLGKTGMHELAWGSTSINPFFGAVCNPWRLDHHPGGSSGGSAAAVAAGMAYAALGSDTGCSIRQPAQCCGIVGFKPSFGLVSKSGAVPLAWSMDHVGPLTRRVGDALQLVQALAGYDESDPYSAERPLDDFSRCLGDSLQGRVVGVPGKYFYEGGDPEVVDLVARSLDAFRDMGATPIELDIAGIETAYDAAACTFAEVVAAHGDAWRKKPQAFSQSIRNSMHHYERRSAAEYAEAQHFRRKFKKQVDTLMRRCDVLLTPTSTVAAAPIAAQPASHGKERWKNTGIFNFTGQPSVSVPCGFTRAGLPVGMMITGRMFDDARVFQYARAFEEATGWHHRHPALD